MLKDVQGKALLDYFHNPKNKKPLILNNDYGKPEEMPKDVFFLKHDELSDLDLFALSLCKGSVLDVGAGVGRHALVLQKNHPTTALEISPICAEIMRKRGVKEVVEDDIFNYPGDNQFDTILLLMNGIGLSGSLDGIKNLLKKFKELLKDAGQVIFDSSDISYLYRDTFFPQDRYFGEVKYQYEYKGEKDEWFQWIYIDKKTLEKQANKVGYQCQIIYQGNSDQYLARLTLA